MAFAVQGLVMLVYSLAVYALFHLREGEHMPWLKYVSIFVDLAVLHFAVVATAVNHGGVIEYFHGFLPYTIAMMNLLSGFRFSVKACLYSAVVSAVMSAVVIWWTTSAGLVTVSPLSVWGEKAINLGDEAMRATFIAGVGGVAAVMARIARNLVVRAEQESLERATLEKRRERLSKYLSKELTAVVIDDPDRLELGGERREATILFADIRNFTPYTEAREPEEVVAFLNRYFTDMVDIVFRHGGTLDKFLGDGLMAVFGAPFDLPDHELRDLLVGLEMMRATEAIKAKLGEDAHDLRIGVGIATGPVVAGNIGSLERMEYTCIGDAVNFAARLEGLNRSLGTQVVIDQPTRDALGDQLPVKALPALKVKGKKGTPSLFSIDVAHLEAEAVAALSHRVLGPADAVPEEAPSALH